MMDLSMSENCSEEIKMETRITEVTGEKSKKLEKPVPNVDTINMIKNEILFDAVEKSIRNLKEGK